MLLKKLFKKPRKVFITLVILAILGYAGFIYKDRFWERKDNQKGYQSKYGNEKTQEDQPSDSSSSSTESEISRYQKDCHNNCGSYSGAEQKRCFEVCGLSEEEQTESDETCEQKSGNDRDTCYKNQAVNEKDDSLCENISNSTLKESCINAVAEEVLEGL